RHGYRAAGRAELLPLRRPRSRDGDAWLRAQHHHVDDPERRLRAGVDPIGLLRRPGRFGLPAAKHDLRQPTGTPLELHGNRRLHAIRAGRPAREPRARCSKLDERPLRSPDRHRPTGLLTASHERWRWWWWWWWRRRRRRKRRDRPRPPRRRDRELDDIA